MSWSWIKRGAGLVMAALVSVTAMAAPPPERPAAGDGHVPPVPLLWKVDGADGAALYLLGSFHLLKPADYPLSADVDTAFAASRQLLFELAPEEMGSPALATQMAQSALRQDGRELKDDLDAETWQRLQAYAAANGLPLERLAGLKPWFVGLTISLAQMARQGLDAASGLDRHLMARAADAGKSALGLESAAAQIALLDGMEIDEQRQLLREALEQVDKGDEQSRRLHDAWRRGDAETLWHDMAAQMKRDYPALYRRINSERNDAWLAPLQTRLQAGQGTTLVVVGALHLLGEDGVVEKLRARGYPVQRVCTACVPEPGAEPTAAGKRRRR
ncbi:TraB/GumN family protein [Stenotrophomonas mori]|uniref:TraB/GumN family protein n=1 Tax=Stenotrophomonas mori TaxID=2871096 RepID=A0ABT0SFF7_9GAMM|nr:TraB/GumN family protein [Stenotrophomonas mori]MCL7714057.1 TraB/GumN family protein [Stenotrophomonas mori]